MTEVKAYFIEELPKLESESLTGIRLVDFEMLPMEATKEMLSHAFRALVPEGVLEFPVLSFAWCVEYYLVGRGIDTFLSQIMFGTERKAIWDEGAVVRALFDAGFYRLWTGRVPEYPEWMFYAKAVKLNKAKLLS